MTSTFKTRDLLLLLLLCAVAYWWRLGTVGLIDPDEPFYAQTAREMVETGDWMTPRIFGHPQFEKPIFFYWMTAASYRVFGQTEFAGRIPSALPATLMVLLVYGFGVRFANRRAGLLAAVVLGTGFEFAIMSRLMLTDIALALFIAASMFCYWLAMEDEEHRGRWVVWHFVWAGMAVLTKGPFASFVMLLATVSYAVAMKRPSPYRGRALWVGIAAYLLINAPWYGAMFAWYPRPFWDEFFVRDNFLRLIRAEHPANNHWWYYVLLLTFGSVPWMPMVVAASVRAGRGLRHDARLAFLWCWILSSLVFLTLAQSKLPSYIFYVFVPLALVIGLMLDDILTRGFRSAGEKRLLLALGVLQCLVALAAPGMGWLRAAGVAVLPKLAQLSDTAKPFAAPALLVVGCLALGLVLLWRGRLVPWLAAHALATVGLIVGALSWSLDHVDAFSSARPVARKMMAERRGDEPLLSGKFLARGIHFYTRQPVTVLASKAQPFWAAHPVAVVAGRKGLAEFLKTNPSVLCTLRRSEWPQWEKSEVGKFAGEPQWSGDNVIVRFAKPR